MQSTSFHLFRASFHLFSKLVEIDGLVAAGAETDHLASCGRAGQRRDRGADLRGDGAEDGKPGL